MQWDDQAFRGCGMVVDFLRDWWLYACLVALRDDPQTPTELLERFQSARRANAAVFGAYSIYPENVTRHLRPLTRAGLIEARPLSGRRREYAVTGLGGELLDSLGLVGVYGRGRYEWLARSARLLQHMDPAVRLEMRSPGDSDEVTEERLTRRATALVFGVVLGPKWSFATLASLVRTPLRPYRIIAVVNAAVAASPDVVTGHLAHPTLTARLEALQRIGLVVEVPATVGHRTSYTLTLRGRLLMEALEPVAAFGIARDAEMTAAIRAM